MLSICCNSRIKSWSNKKDTQRISKMKPFISKYKLEGINFTSVKDDREKTWEKEIERLLSMFCMIKKKNISCLCFKICLKLWKTSCSFNDSKWRGMALSCSKNINIIKRNSVKTRQWFSLSELSLFFLQRKTNVNLIKKYAKIKIFVMPPEETKILKFN